MELDTETLAIRRYHINQLIDNNILFVNEKAITKLTDRELLLAYDCFIHCKDDNEIGKPRTRLDKSLSLTDAQ